MGDDRWKTRMVPWPRAASAAQAFIVFSLVLLSVSTVLLVMLAHRIETASECRFDREADINAINDSIDLWTGRGLAAVVREDDARIEEALSEIDDLSDRFEGMIVSRQTIAEKCD